MASIKKLNMATGEVSFIPDEQASDDYIEQVNQDLEHNAHLESLGIEIEGFFLRAYKDEFIRKIGIFETLLFGNNKDRIKVCIDISIQVDNVKDYQTVELAIPPLVYKKEDRDEVINNKLFNAILYLFSAPCEFQCNTSCGFHVTVGSIDVGNFLNTTQDMYLRNMIKLAWLESISENNSMLTRLFGRGNSNFSMLPMQINAPASKQFDTLVDNKFACSIRRAKSFVGNNNDPLIEREIGSTEYPFVVEYRFPSLGTVSLKNNFQVVRDMLKNISTCLIPYHNSLYWDDEFITSPMYKKLSLRTQYLYFIIQLIAKNYYGFNKFKDNVRGMLLRYLGSPSLVDISNAYSNPAEISPNKLLNISKAIGDSRVFFNEDEDSIGRKITTELLAYEDLFLFNALKDDGVEVKHFNDLVKPHRWSSRIDYMHEVLYPEWADNSKALQKPITSFTSLYAVSPEHEQRLKAKYSLRKGNLPEGMYMGIFPWLISSLSYNP